MDVTSILDSLNDAQRAAVTSDAKSLLVLAGAGSGKTRVLVHRIGWIIAAEDLSPWSILAVTFTNKAAAEMRGRIEQLLQTPAAGLWIGTFHSIAHRLLRAHWQEAGLTQNFEILDAEDQLRLIKRVMKELDIDEQRWPARSAQHFINSSKDEGLRPRHIDARGDFHKETMLRVYIAYEEACARGGMVDFNELLLRTHELWLNHADLRAHYQQRFRHILVDEFQDTNAVQYAWLQLLVNENNRITIVGDDDQSIYGWRGARIENIQRFSRDFADASIVRLEQNYRSTSTILDAANAVIAKNHGRLGKELWTNGDKGQPIGVYSAFNELDEANFAVDQVKRWMQQGRTRSEVAVLYRSNAQSRVLEEAFLRNNIPYRIWGGQRFFERAEIKNALAYLRLLETRHSDSAFERVVNLPTRGIGAKTLDTLRLMARTHQVSLWTAAARLLNDNALPARAAGALSGFTTLIDTMDAETRELDLSGKTEHVIHRSGVFEFHRNERGEKAQQRLENLNELVSAAREFADEADIVEGMSELTAFLDHAALEAGEGQAEAYEDCVQMMTLHSAKGLEFPLVFLVGLEEGLFPHQMSLDTPDGIEEERRLCYVGITRAMEKLFISHAECRRQWGDETYARPSQFIRDIPQSLKQEVRLKGDVTRPMGNAPEGESPYQTGRNVRHPSFGDGVVLAYEGNGPNARVQVNFAKVGKKWLIAQYARLEFF